MSSENHLNKENIKEEHEQGFLEKIFEKVLWNTRYTVILAVIFSVLGSSTCSII